MCFQDPGAQEGHVGLHQLRQCTDHNKPGMDFFFLILRHISHKQDYLKSFNLF